MASLSNRRLMELSQVPAAEQDQIFNRFYSRRSQGCSPEKQPELTILAGFPATGKSTYAGRLKNEKPNTMVIGADDFYPEHPHMFELFEASPVRLNSKERDCYDNELLDDFVDEGFRKTFARALHQKYNILLDQQPTESLLDYARIAQEIGYKVRIIYCAAPKREIETNMILRFEKGCENYREAKAGRLPRTGDNVPHSIAQMRLDPEYMKDAKKLIRQTVACGYETQIINPRQNKILYDSTRSAAPAARIFEEEVYRNLTPEESRRRDISIAKIGSMMDRRGASAYERCLLTALKKPLALKTPIPLPTVRKQQAVRT